MRISGFAAADVMAAATPQASGTFVDSMTSAPGWGVLSGAQGPDRAARFRCMSQGPGGTRVDFRNDRAPPQVWGRQLVVFSGVGCHGALESIAPLTCVHLVEE